MPPRTSRGAILEAASRLATVEGLEGLSIARLADAVGMSKSGLFAHFGSKEELQLATIEHAVDVFGAVVTEPAAGRLDALIDRYLAYVEGETFPGGCFFASALSEVDMRPGPVRDRLVAFLGEWLGTLERAVRDAQDEGALDAAEEPAQLVFELEALLFYANAQYVVARGPEPIARARRAIEARLGRAAYAP
jgi:AcrR family transcriptional regulator